MTSHSDGDDYSRNLEQPEDDDLRDVLMPSSEPECTDEEILAALDDRPSKIVTAAAPASSSASTNVQPTASNIVQPSVSNIVQKSASNKVSKKKPKARATDRQILKKINRFMPSAPVAAAFPTSVSSSVPHPAPFSTAQSHAFTPFTVPHDVNLIPVWEKCGDDVKVTFAVGALLIAETKAVTFNFNLTDEGQHRARVEGLNGLKRSFDDQLKRAFQDITPYYLFAIDDDGDGRLHIHGAMMPPAMTIRSHRKLRKVMKEAWGEWIGPGKRKQLRFETLYSDGWATYIMRNRRAVADIIGKRTFTITDPLRRDAASTYSTVREIMRDYEHRLQQYKD